MDIDNDVNSDESLRLFSPTANDEEFKKEVQLRPQNFDEYIGQNQVVDNIKVMVQSARMRGHAMDHVLLSGPPGLGKTSLAMLIAKEMGTELHVVSGPAIEKKGDLAALLSNIQAGDILFIDEIHRMHVTVEEILYSAMEDYRLDIVIGEGPTARTMQISLAPFTLIGATTRAGLLSTPLRHRFIASLHFDFYSPKELKEIVRFNAVKMQVDIGEEALDHISRCSRGTPRIANRILRRVRDYTVVNQRDITGTEEVSQALLMMAIDQAGLDRMDRKILTVIRDFYQGGPVGIDALCATLSEDRTTIEDVFEPYLLQEGYLIRTPRGREVSSRGLEHLKKYEAANPSESVS